MSYRDLLLNNNFSTSNYKFPALHIRKVYNKIIHYHELLCANISDIIVQDFWSQHTLMVKTHYEFIKYSRHIYHIYKNTPIKLYPLYGYNNDLLNRLQNLKTRYKDITNDYINTNVHHIFENFQIKINELYLLHQGIDTNLHR